ncbi:MAG: hypothetical protein LBT40_09585 [Deltaproteobacteria bacterium]|nr:hypothetical protein [Deltaproteobacteria bacterium]
MPGGAWPGRGPPRTALERLSRRATRNPMDSSARRRRSKAGRGVAPPPRAAGRLKTCFLLTFFAAAPSPAPGAVTGAPSPSPSPAAASRDGA